MNARVAVPRTTRESSWELSLGMVFSVLLHLSVALLAIFGLPFIFTPPPPAEESVPVDLVPLGQVTAAPPPKTVEPQPVEKPPEKPPEPPKQEEVKPEPPKPAPPAPEPPKEVKVEPPKPKPAPPPPPPPQPKAEIPAPEKKPEPPKETPKQQDQLADIKPVRKPPPPTDADFQSLLKTIDKMKPQPQKQDDLAKTIDAMRKSEPRPTPQAPQQLASVATPQVSQISDRASASDIDYVRGQIERHWNFDAGARDAGNLVVQIRVKLQPDGTVISADIVNDARYGSDSYYTSAADSARRAVLAASPLQLPPGKYDAFKDITFTFDPRNAVQ